MRRLRAELGATAAGDDEPPTIALPAVVVRGSPTAWEAGPRGAGPGRIARAGGPAPLVGSEDGGQPKADVELAIQPPGKVVGSTDELARVRVYRLAPRLVGIPSSYWAHEAAGRGEHGAEVRPTLDLALNPGEGCSAALIDRGRVQCVDELILSGVRMERWRPGRPPAERVGAVPADGRFSRTIGALGGAAVHARLAALRAAVFGTGSSVAAFAHALSCAGARVGHVAASADAKLALAAADVAVFDVADGASAADRLATVASRLQRLAVVFVGVEAVRLVVPGEDCAHGTPLPSTRVRDVTGAHFLAGYALFLLERLVAGDVDGPRATALRLDPHGGVTVEACVPGPCTCGRWPERRC